MGQRPTIPAGVTIGVLTLTLVAVTLPGCARARERWKARFNPPEPEPAGLLTPSDDDRAGRGLEIALWTADDTGFRVGRVLAEIATRAGPAGHEAWARSGLRVLAVPSDRVDELLRRAPPVGAVQRQRYAQLPIWTPLVRGPRLDAGGTGPDGRALAPGRPRLIARAWAEPDLSSGRLAAVMRTELTIQIEDAGSGAFSADFSGPRTIASDGPIMASLLTALVSDGSTAFVIVAESPSIDWDELPALAASPGPPGPDSRAETDPPPGPTAPAPGSAEQPGASDAPAVPTGPFPDAGLFGPVATGERTLGERMLASPGIRSVDGRPAVGPRKVLLVLMPRIPGQESPPGAAGGASADPPARPSLSQPASSRQEPL